VNLASVGASKLKRKKTKISELDLVLGGGVVDGMVILLAGEPGVGKSTILLQVAQRMGKVIYASGEESASQIKIRAGRLGVGGEKIEMICTNDIDKVISSVDSGTSFLIVDSIQTMMTGDLTGMMGSVGQVRECAGRLIRLAKETGIVIVLVGHATKEGSVAGPKTLTHMVDCVLWFEGEIESQVRILRSTKNRFGSTDEVGVFQMQEKGLISVTSLENMFLGREGKVPGSVVCATLQGSRVILAEIQSLVVKTNSAYPRRVVQGLDSKRVEMILAVLASRCNLDIYGKDVFVNVVGGLNIKDPGVDLAVSLSIASAHLNKPLSSDFLAVGEIGLLGEIRKATQEKKRVEQGRKQGFESWVGSKNKNLNSLVVRLRKAGS
jgi:DNA repair protein RadA/Sms